MAAAPEPPCEHWEALVGTVSAGDAKTGPFVSVVTCQDCATKSAGYVTLRTGIVANPMLTFKEAREA